MTTTYILATHYDERRLSNTLLAARHQGNLPPYESAPLPHNDDVAAGIATAWDVPAHIAELAYATVAGRGGPSAIVVTATHTHTHVFPDPRTINHARAAFLRELQDALTAHRREVAE